MRTPDFLPIEFIIIGGSITGLSTAIALSRVGHKVTLFDITDAFVGTVIDAGARLPPNATKVFYRWGVEQRLRQCSVKSTGTVFAHYDSGSVVASYDWEEDVLEETGGDFLLMHYRNLRRILAESAREHGATLRFNTRLVGVKADRHRPSVTLQSGEVVTADVIIGADGNGTDGNHVPGWLCRREVMKAIGQEDVNTPMGMQLFNALIPESEMDRLEDKKMLAKLRQTGKVFMWYGSEYGVMGFPVAPETGDPLFTLLVFAPMRFDAVGERCYNTDREALLEGVRGADPRLAELAVHATKIDAVPMIGRPTLDDWVHPDGRILCVGEAAHPQIAGTIYGIGMAAGDAAVIGRLFSHLHRKEQIDSFLSAVQEIRQERVDAVMAASQGNIFAVSLPPGLAEAHDRALRERAERGIRSLSDSSNGSGGGGGGGGGRVARTSEEMMAVVENIFAYDPEDEADDWWVEWGIMQERVARWDIADEVEVEVKEDHQRTGGASPPGSG